MADLSQRRNIAYCIAWAIAIGIPLTGLGWMVYEAVARSGLIPLIAALSVGTIFAVWWWALFRVIRGKNG